MTWPCANHCGRVLTYSDIIRSKSGYCRYCLEAQAVAQYGSVEEYDRQFLHACGVSTED